MEESDILGRGGQNVPWPSYIFSGSSRTSTPMIYAPVSLCVWRMASAVPDLRFPLQLTTLLLIAPTHEGMARLSSNQIKSHVFVSVASRPYS